MIHIWCNIFREFEFFINSPFFIVARGDIFMANFTPQNLTWKCPEISFFYFSDEDIKMTLNNSNPGKIMDCLSLRQTEDKPLGQIGQLLGWSLGWPAPSGLGRDPTR